MKPKSPSFLSSTDARLGLYVCTWVGALLAVSHSPKAIVLLPFFPAGLASIIGVDPHMFSFFVILGWISYAAHAWLSFKTPLKEQFWVLYAVLVLLLVLDVAGCKSLIAMAAAGR